MGDATRAGRGDETTPQFNSYAEFWPHYLGEHSRPATLAVFFVATGRWLWLPVALVPGYGLSWIGHFFVEHNRPATFGHPAWSMLSDFRMIWLVLTGRIGRELARLRADG